MAIGDGSTGNWEVFQFADAEPVGNGRWDITQRLRGQAGTDALAPTVWPAGSVVVLLDGGVKQVDLPPSALGQERFWRLGPSSKRPDDGSFRSVTTTISGIGLRPYAPCHLRADGNRLSWIRRTRLNGDSWEGTDVPLGEAKEEYLVRVSQGGILLHQATLSQPNCTVPADVWQAAKAAGSINVSVAQLSEVFGAGPVVRRNF